MRVALYWTPSPSDLLAKAGHAWLGRDPELGVPLPPLHLPGIAGATAAPRVYGFHATLRPPMRLATGWEEFLESADALAARTAPFALPPLAVQDMSGFLALGLTEQSPMLHALADACVRVTDPHRLRPDETELARRRIHTLSADQDALLLRWGYPHVMEHWRFHMTLTCRLTDAEMTRLRPAADAHFAAPLAAPQTVSDLAIFTQRDDDGRTPFLIAERLRLRG